jgi:predicted TIM-barrel enzyme
VLNEYFYNADKAIVGTYFKPDGTIEPKRVEEIVSLKNM